ncbi:serine/threonine-protein kinase MRCK alpha-like [Mobula hypostoma]|uniref:serine/threonine-protein kinase MRCK alpha-like n=1 Tax=Mobula hypostoma TaxID=723540 RepID=UPI002FC3CB9A
MDGGSGKGDESGAPSVGTVSPEQRLRQLERLMARGAAADAQADPRISQETLLDLLLCLFYECSSSRLCRDQAISDFLQRVTPLITRVKELQLHRDDFEILKVIGRGAFGEVAVVKMKESEKVFAMKILHKWEMLKRADAACFREERDILVRGRGRWITRLHYAFQDELYLYLVMDYYAGGDLLTLLSKFEDRLPEDLARFYVAEMVLAIDAIHHLNYVHRDIKPDNVLIDVSGHIRVADFGSCLQLGQDGTVETSVAVGTPDYISPEILQAMEDGKGKYGSECDWWSLGVCVYELLFGETPFYAESLVETYGKIMNHKDKLMFPADEDDVSEEARDLIGQLVCSKEKRLGRAGIADLQQHAFFTSIDWQNIADQTPPYIPEVASPTDTSNFDLNDNVLKTWDSAPPRSRGAFSGLHLPFVGFTYTSSSWLSDREAGAPEDRDTQADERGAPGAEGLGFGLPEGGTEGGRMREGAAPTREVQSLEEQLQTLSQQRDEALVVTDGLREELSARSGELREARELADRELRQREDELEAARQEARRLQRELDRSPRAKEEVQPVQSLGAATGEGERSGTSKGELRALRGRLEESEGQCQRLEAELSACGEQLEAAKRELELAQREALSEETQLLRGESRELRAELESLRDQLEKVRATNKQLEEELGAAEARRESASQWDSQIAEIIQWVGEEKEARGYLHALANRMSEEVQSLRRTSLAKPVDRDWKSRRLQKVEASARLELQSALESEIRAKQQLQEQLDEAKAAGLHTECKLQDAEKEIESLKQEVERLKKEAEVRSQRGLQQERLLAFLPCLPDELPDGSASSTDSGKFSPTQSPGSPGAEVAGAGAKPSSPTASVKKPPVPAPRSLPGTKPTPHQFKIQSFSVPTKCMRCTSVMVGVVRQGVNCEVCHFRCHAGCSAGALGCPAPPQQIRSLGIEPSRGTGTALEGNVSVPKPAGVRRGWQRAFAILSDCRLLVFEAAEPKATGAAHVFDLRDEGFAVTPVFSSDVIHANKKDVPCIFRVTASQLRVPNTKTSLLVLADSESEKRKWVAVISELVSICKQNGLRESLALEAMEAYDNTLPLIRSVQSGAILDQKRIALGTDDGLFLLHLTKNELTLLGDRKRIHLVVPVPGSDLLAAISGRGRSLRLYSREERRAPEAGGGAKVPEGRGAQLVAAGALPQPGSGCLCLASRRQVTCLRLCATEPRCRPLRQFQAPGNVQWMGVFGERLCVGYPSGFSLYPLLSQGPAQTLVSPQDPTLGFLTQPPAEALCAAPLSADLYLLCFSSVGVYVNGEGRRARQQEMVWPATPLAAACRGNYLTVYSGNTVNVFNVGTAEWIQTIPLKKMRPLSADGSLNLAACEPYRLVYLRSEERGTAALVLPETPSSSRRQMYRTQSKRRFAFRISEVERAQQWREMLSDPQARSKLISNPSNFSHVVHVGPGKAIPALQEQPSPVNSPDEKGQLSFNLPTFRHRSSTESGLISFLSNYKASGGSATGSPPRQPVNSPDEKGQLSFNLPTFRHRSSTESGLISFLSNYKASGGSATGSSSSHLPRKQISMDSTSLADF